MTPPPARDESEPTAHASVGPLAQTPLSQVALGLAVAAGIILLAVITGTQVVPMTRLLEGYWQRAWMDRTLGRIGRCREGKRRARLAQGASALCYLQSYLAFPPEPAPVLPTRLGNALLAAEAYPGDAERWGLDAAFWWPGCTW